MKNRALAGLVVAVLLIAGIALSMRRSNDSATNQSTNDQTTAEQSPADFGDEGLMTDTSPAGLESPVTAALPTGQAGSPSATATSDSAASSTTAATTVEINDFAFSPATVRVKAGQKITVVNRDSVGHTLTSTDNTTFDTGMLADGDSATITAPSKPGSYPFYCRPHPQMKGTLIVE